MVATLHRLRETLVGTRIGRQFVSDYEDERVAEAFTKALTNEPNLGLQALGIVVEALPLIRRLSGYEVSTRSDDIQVPDRLVERTSKFLTAAAGDNKLLAEPLARVREFVEASRCRTALECYQALDPGEHDDEK
jgi:hypothetical protein